MSGGVVDIQRAREDRFDRAWAMRQRKLAGLYCSAGHSMERRAASHFGPWTACTRCGLIAERDEE
jgi:hypothetical protein